MFDSDRLDRASLVAFAPGTQPVADSFTHVKSREKGLPHDCLYAFR